MKQSFLDGLKINKPTVLLDVGKAKSNIQRMQEKATAANVTLRPHFKTHQSAAIGEWFREQGTKAITVSSVSMARYFADYGWDDITVAILVNRHEMDEINVLAGMVRLNLLVDSLDIIHYLAANLRHSLNLFLKVDTGYGRSGVPWNQADNVLKMARAIIYSEKLNFAGLLTHAGHSYNAESVDQILRIHQETVDRMVDLKEYLGGHGISECMISVGDTPCCSIATDFNGIDEIRPGNYVFYDLKQQQLGSCTLDDIAVAIACPVIGKYPERNQVVVYGGAVHFSKDYFQYNDDKSVFGVMVQPGETGWVPMQKNAYITSVSQEHGKVYLPDDMINSVHIGDFLLFLPVHSCLTCNLHRYYLTLEGGYIKRMNSLM